MPSAAAVKVRVSFGAATPDLNRVALSTYPADIMVSEFDPGMPGVEWVPFHVRRTLDENRAALQAALAGRVVTDPRLFVAPGTALGDLRRLASELAGSGLAVYDEHLRPTSLLRWAVVSGINRQLAPGSRTRKWLYRLTHPAEAEVPFRARLAKLQARHPSRQGHANLVASSNVATIPGVSVVIPTRDGRDLLAALLPHFTADEIIVVDNGSKDGTEAWLRTAYPSVQVIHHATPLSFAKAVNLGIFAARHNRVLLLNNDMIPAPGFIAALEAAFARVPNLFCATAQIFFPPGIRREETGKAVWRREDPLDFPVRCDDPLPGEDLTWVFYGSGGCSLFDTAMLRELGGVSELYDPAYVEDMDFGYRAWQRGWPTVFVADARVEHRHRATTSRFYSAEDLDFFVERNYLRFLEATIATPDLFLQLWDGAIRRLQLQAMNGSRAALRALRDAPRVGPRPAVPATLLTEAEIFALGNGDIAAFPGRIPGHRRKVIVASPYLPFPLSHGGAVRIFNLLRQAGGANDIILIAFADALETPPPALLELCVEVVLVRRHGTHIRQSTPRPDVVEEFESDTFRACLKQTAQRWDAAIVQLEFTWMAQYAGRYGRARTILVEHDITFDLQRQMLESGPDNYELRQQFQKWQAFETAAWREVDCVVTMSPKDEAAVACAPSVVTIPNGVDCERFSPRGGEQDPKRLLFIGSFAHLPNLLALEWFLREVWPRLSGYTLHIIAGPRPEYYANLHRARVSVELTLPGIELEAFVADVRPAYQRAGLVLAPLVASAGTNIKVLEAMAMERVVVGTSAGFHGLPVTPGVDCILAETGEAMASAILDRGSRREMEQAARATALKFDWSAIGELQEMTYHRLDVEKT